GAHSLSAGYQGSVNFVPSLSMTVGQSVSQASTTTAVQSTSPSSVFGQPVTVSAQVSAAAPGSGVPTGPVDFYDGALYLGTGGLTGSGDATFPTSTLAVATHAITAVYGGDLNFLGGTSPVSPFDVGRAPTAAWVTAGTPNPIVFGQWVTFDAFVTAIPPFIGPP